MIDEKMATNTAIGESSSRWGEISLMFSLNWKEIKLGIQSETKHKFKI